MSRFLALPGCPCGRCLQVAPPSSDCSLSRNGQRVQGGKTATPSLFQLSQDTSKAISPVCRLQTADPGQGSSDRSELGCATMKEDDTPVHAKTKRWPSGHPPSWGRTETLSVAVVTNMHRIIWGLSALAVVSYASLQSPARCRYQSAWVRACFFANSVRLSLYQCCPRAPLALTRPFIQLEDL